MRQTTNRRFVAATLRLTFLLSGLFFFLPAAAMPRAAPPPVRPGIETFLADVPRSLRGKRVGFITNHTGIDRQRNSDIDLIAKHKELKLVALLAPEHGIRGTTEAGERVSDETDPRTGVPVYSLYQSEDRGPTPDEVG